MTAPPFLRIIEYMNVKTTNKIALIAKIVLPILCIAWVAFIFSNSLRTGEESSKQSTEVVETVQTVVGWVAPDSPIVNATGEQFDLLHHFVRKAAHFTEFAILGALLCWCYFVYTLRLKHLYLPVAGALLVPLLDEGLQKLISGRAGMLADVLIDVSGSITGLAFAGIFVWMLVTVSRYRKSKQKKNEISMVENKE